MASQTSKKVKKKKEKVVEFNYERLITLVSENEVLFNPRHKSGKDIELTNNIWRHIGKQLGATGEDAKEKWRHKVDTYKRNKKKKRTKSGQARDHYLTQWKWHNHMQFIEPFIKMRRTDTNLDISLNSSDKSSESENDSDNETGTVLASTMSTLTAASDISDDASDHDVWHLDRSVGDDQTQDASVMSPKSPSEPPSEPTHEEEPGRTSTPRNTTSSKKRVGGRLSGKKNKKNKPDHVDGMILDYIKDLKQSKVEKVVKKEAKQNTPSNTDSVFLQYCLLEMAQVPSRARFQLRMEIMDLIRMKIEATEETEYQSRALSQTTRPTSSLFDREKPNSPNTTMHKAIPQSNTSAFDKGNIKSLTTTRPPPTQSQKKTIQKSITSAFDQGHFKPPPPHSQSKQIEHSSTPAFDEGHFKPPPPQSQSKATTMHQPTSAFDKETYLPTPETTTQVLQQSNTSAFDQGNFNSPENMQQRTTQLQSKQLPKSYTYPFDQENYLHTTEAPKEVLQQSYTYATDQGNHSVYAEMQAYQDTSQGACGGSCESSTYLNYLNL